MKSFKNVKADNTEFDANTYTKEEVFATGFVAELNNNKTWKVEEMKTFYHGRCFVLHYL